MMTKNIGNPILLDVPTAFETERLLIRAPQIGEGAALNEAIRESIEELSPWLPWVHPVPTVEDSEQYARESHAKFLLRQELAMRLISKENGELVGCGGLHVLSWSIPRFEPGYWCRTKYSGQGFITEATRGLTRFAFDCLNAQCVSIRCDARNERSRRVIERCGFTFEGTLRRSVRERDNVLRDMRHFSILREEFEQRNNEWPAIKVLS
jgi:RimJ/RimL family protein N-acetyltransferase